MKKVFKKKEIIRKCKFVLFDIIYYHRNFYYFSIIPMCTHLPTTFRYTKKVLSKEIIIIRKCKFVLFDIYFNFYYFSTNVHLPRR